MGMFGIASAPARTMTSEQTDARIGRRMNVSTNMYSSARRLEGPPSRRPAPRSGARQTLALARRSRRRLSRLAGLRRSLASLDRRAVADLLHVRHDDTVAGGEPALHDVVVADDAADGDGLLAGDEPLVGLLGDEDEVLAGDAADRHHRHRQ